MLYPLGRSGCTKSSTTATGSFAGWKAIASACSQQASRGLHLCAEVAFTCILRTPSTRAALPHDQPTHIAEFHGRGTLIDDPVLYTSREFPWGFIDSSFTMLGAGNELTPRISVWRRSSVARVGSAPISRTMPLKEAVERANGLRAMYPTRSSASRSARGG